MTHADLLKTSEYLEWNRAFASGDPSDKRALDHLRAWFRRMSAAFDVMGGVIPEGTIRVPTEEPAYPSPGEHWSLEQFTEFARTINALSRDYDLPAPFRLAPDERLTSTQVAAELGVSIRRAQQLMAVHPDAELLGRDWVLPRGAIEDLRERPGRGWPRGKPRKADE